MVKVIAIMESKEDGTFEIRVRGPFPDIPSAEAYCAGIRDQNLASHIWKTIFDVKTGSVDMMAHGLKHAIDHHIRTRWDIERIGMPDTD